MDSVPVMAFQILVQNLAAPKIVVMPLKLVLSVEGLPDIDGAAVVQQVGEPCVAVRPDAPRRGAAEVVSAQGEHADGACTGQAQQKLGGGRVKVGRPGEARQQAVLQVGQRHARSPAAAAENSVVNSVSVSDECVGHGRSLLGVLEAQAGHCRCAVLIGDVVGLDYQAITS